ncbi:SdpI family protein [Saccharothrix syringae]|uniref:SdpI family protein n=1 Tax=Saccharothrix syringae TaxID=103733 RepID=A0A5Q0HAF7_SACSY|nr:SdpI family protein [Saccharothrix syringae]QFZ23226.1 SdpI family protein [Saccharothrix syringae]
MGSQAPAWVTALLFAAQVLLAACLFTMAHLGARGKLPRNPFFGLRTGRAQAGDDVWRHVHRRAAPLAYAAVAAVLVGLVAMALADGAGLLVALLVTDAAVGVLLVLATWRGHRDLPTG